jgi:hypothetical protein
MSGEYKQDRTYSQEEIDAIASKVGEFPGFTPPSTGGLQDLDKHIAWQTRMRKKDLGRYRDIYKNEPFRQGATDYAQQTLGGAPQNLQSYFQNKGISPQGDINADIGNTAGAMHTDAQKKIMTKAKQLQIATLQQMLGHVGDPSAGMAGIATAGLASDSQSSQILAQGYQNALMQIQQEFPQPQLRWQEDSGFGPLAILGGIAGGIGGAFLGNPIGGASLGFNAGMQFG